MWLKDSKQNKMCTKWHESLPCYSCAICWNQAATWDRTRKDRRRKWKWKTGDEIEKEDRAINTREISMPVRTNVLFLLYLPLFVRISPRLSLFPLSSALHLLYSANVFCLLFPLLHCHSRFPSPLQPVPSYQRVNWTVKKAAAPAKTTGNQTSGEPCWICFQNWKPYESSQDGPRGNPHFEVFIADVVCQAC